MTLADTAESRLGRGFVILAPSHANEPSSGKIVDRPEQHKRLLAEIQKLRAVIYLGDGAIKADQIHPSGCFMQREDNESWHLLTVNQEGRVTAGIRYLAHRPHTSYLELQMSEGISHLPSPFPEQVKRAVETELAKAQSSGLKFVELGAWVVGEELRCSTEAVRMLMMIYALSQALGGALALCTATRRHNCAGILRRTGGKPLALGGVELPSYYDPHYDCQMEVLCFDSRFPNPRYAGWIGEFREALSQIPMIAPSSSSTVTADLLQLDTALTDSSRPTIHDREIRPAGSEHPHPARFV